MAYTIRHTNGQNPYVIPDGTINTTTTLTFVGKNYPNYGQILDQNFLYLLENSANTTAPTAPVIGQLWWDTSHNSLKIWTSALWKNVSGATPSSTAPVGVVVGDSWWDTVNSQLKIYDGSTWVVIGPPNTTSGTTGPIVETIKDINQNNHVVISIYINNARYAIWSNTAFNPLSPISGFQTNGTGTSNYINPGLNLATTDFLTGGKFWGQASDSLQLSGLYANAFLRADTSSTTVGSLGVNQNFYVGASSNFKLSVTNPDVYMDNQTNNGIIHIRTKNNLGTTNDALEIYPNGNVVANFDMVVLGNLVAQQTNDYLIINGTTSSTGTTTGAVQIVGGTAIQGNLNVGGPVNNFVGNITAANVMANVSVVTPQVYATGFNGTINTNTQPYINTLGTLTGLTVNGTTTSINLGGTLTTAAQPNVTTLGTLLVLNTSGVITQSNTNAATSTTTGAVKIAGGLGVVGNVWAGSFYSDSYKFANGLAITTPPAGSATQVQYNNGTNFAADSGLTYNSTTHALTATGTITGGAFSTAGTLSVTSTAATGALTVTGAITATGDVTAFYSDDRLKDRHGNIVDALVKVNSLNGFNYTANELAQSMGYEVRPEVGVSAQEVQAVLPEVVVPAPIDPEYLTVKYEKLVPLLIEAIKELSAKVEELEKKAN